MVRRLLLLLLALALLAGCGGKKAEPTLAVTAEQRETSLVIRIQTTHFVMGKDGHAHIRLNGGPEAMIYANTYTVPNLAPGRYEIDVELSDPKHVDLGIRQLIEFEMKP